jgi:four helix bundle suffix protein
MSGLLAPRGDFKRLLTYQKAEILYDLTFYFAHAHLTRGDRTVDQMVQAARSGKQNIAEASAAAVTSAETEIKLTNVAKASLIELRIDYEDYLRVRELRRWEKDSKEALYLRNKSRDPSVTSIWYLEIAKTRPAETTANLCICLLHQADYLLQRQLEALESKFLAQGGFKEKMFAARLQSRSRNAASPRPSAPSLPSLPSPPRPPTPSLPSLPSSPSAPTPSPPSPPSPPSAPYAQPQRPARATAESMMRRINSV